MRVQNLVGRRLRDVPREAQTPGHQILLRGGYVQQIGQGLFTLLPLAQRACRKISGIIREEMDALGCQELEMPVVVPAELWQESGRYQRMGSEMVRFQDRTGRDMVLSMTHEEVVVRVAGSQIESYRQLPVTLYQIQTKFRDEPRSRGGLLRVREFLMKDAYSFHREPSCLEEIYEAQRRAYQHIFRRCGLRDVVDIRSDGGMMGDGVAHEFMLLHPIGEDTLVLCPSCGYRANREVARSHPGAAGETPGSDAPLSGEGAPEEVATPGYKTIQKVADFLGLPPSRCIKAVAFVADSERRVLVFVRGDLEVEQAKLRGVLQARELRPMEEEEIVACGTVPGYIGPHGLGDTEVLLDPSIPRGEDLCCGANREGYHLTGFRTDRDLGGDEVYRFADVVAVRPGDPCPECQAPLSLERGIEVGNLFQLGQRYTEAMGVSYLEEDGTPRTPWMGCYGIGVGRTFAAQVEENHDEYGPLFPMSIAPYQVQVVVLNAKKAPLREAGRALYQELLDAGVEAILDDRRMGVGAMMADADLIGAPLRLVVSKRNLEAGELEVRTRTCGPVPEIPERIPREGAAGRVRELVEILAEPYRRRP